MYKVYRTRDGAVFTVNNKYWQYTQRLTDNGNTILIAFQQVNRLPLNENATEMECALFDRFSATNCRLQEIGLYPPKNPDEIYFKEDRYIFQPEDVKKLDVRSIYVNLDENDRECRRAYNFYDEDNKREYSVISDGYFFTFYRNELVSPADDADLNGYNMRLLDRDKGFLGWCSWLMHHMDNIKYVTERWV